MRYLFIYRWADFSEISDNLRENIIDPIFLMYSTAIKLHGREVYYINSNDNIHTKEQLIRFIKKEKIDTVIFQTNIDNLNSIINLDLPNTIQRVNFVLLSINEDLRQLVKEPKYNLIVNDERISIEENILLFLKTLNIQAELKNIKELQIDYSYEKILQNKTPLINIGSGCRAECSFCNIANSSIQYRPVDIIIKEIVSLLDRGIKYFHLMNHNFSCDRDFMCEFCSKLENIALNYDFIWSCYVIPSYFIHNLDLLPLMYRSNLRKIEIGCETGSTNLLSELGIKHTNSIIKKIITASHDEKISAFSLHFILGTSKENTKSLLETRDLIFKILDLTESSADILLHCYFPENISHKRCFPEIVSKKNEFIYPSESLTIEELRESKKQLSSAIKLKRDEWKNKIGIKKLYEFYKLEKRYGVMTQIWRDVISKSYNYVLFEKKESFENVFYSWEITDSTSKYSLLFNKFGDFRLPEKLNSDCSNLYEVLDNYIRHGYTVEEIIDKINRESKGNITKEKIYTLIEKLESESILYYVKYLK